MVGIYFSGTGNSKYTAESFCKEYDGKAVTYSIEDHDAVQVISSEELIVLAYPV